MIKKIMITAILLGFVGIVFAEGPDAAVMEKGKKIFGTYCFTCHQPNGQGLPGAFPPLAKSDYLIKNSKESVIKSVVNGLQGKVTVNGMEYNNVMTPLPPNYTNADAAAVITFVYNSWGNPGGVITEEMVAKVRNAAK